jgi:hypothetical protein
MSLEGANPLLSTKLITRTSLTQAHMLGDISSATSGVAFSRFKSFQFSRDLGCKRSVESLSNFNMSFPNFDYSQAQQGPEEAQGGGVGAPQQQQTPMGQQPGENAQRPFQGGGSGESDGAGGPQQGGDSKTTLW